MKRKRVIIPIIIITLILLFIIIKQNYTVRYKNYSVSENKWNSIISSRTSSNSLKLKEIFFNEYRLVIDGSSDTIYYSIVEDSINKYNPLVSYTSSNKENIHLAILDDEITDDKVKSGYNFKIMIYNKEKYHIYNLVCTDLPILDISENGNIKNNKLLVKMYLFDNISNVANRIVISDGDLRVGKDSYHLTLNKITPGNNIRRNDISILGMPKSSEYILKEASKDRSENINSQVLLLVDSKYMGVYNIEPAYNEPMIKIEGAGTSPSSFLR